MAAHDLSAVVVSADNDYMGGYIKYLTDEPATTGYRVSLVFPQDGPMTMVRHGAAGYDALVPPNPLGFWRGPGRLRKVNSFATVHYTDYYEGDLLVDTLRPYATQRIGLVGLAQMSAATIERLRAGLPGATFVNASHVVDEVRMVRSSEEQELIRRTAASQDAVMKEVADMIRPGLRESDITAFARMRTEEMGSEQGTYIAGSTTTNEPNYMAARHYQNRVLAEGDIFYLLLEANGPGGLWAQLGRTFTIGPAPRVLVHEYELTLEALDYCTSLLVPGASCADVWRKYDSFVSSQGRRNDEVKRLHCHGQGYDIVERPLIRDDEPGTIEAGMNIACHPVHTHENVVSWISENFLIEPDGAVGIHHYPRELIQVQ